ncbi:uncharacterized protein ACA1_360770 [Acanthamoeba castellanii str. Neff]|uniref:Uncharacterized protein n=1 Tax=Acanthamoeba castellanii (strain ATCC 30010 / Neff) TaxID=1257118 RepID=L8HF63_ACACF|nr:uncharacterized protein ACA1_360770 [Acanthamoeba castellanii str. Neff]ELR23051.1 hypothetical protein ACA1_360770 [Acanthamoeba castellanii str. Neff]
MSTILILSGSISGEKSSATKAKLDDTRKMQITALIGMSNGCPIALWKVINNCYGNNDVALQTAWCDLGKPDIYLVCVGDMSINPVFEAQFNALLDDMPMDAVLKALDCVEALHHATSGPEMAIQVV